MTALVDLRLIRTREGLVALRADRHALALPPARTAAAALRQLADALDGLGWLTGEDHLALLADPTGPLAAPT